MLTILLLLLALPLGAASAATTCGHGTGDPNCNDPEALYCITGPSSPMAMCHSKGFTSVMVPPRFGSLSLCNPSKGCTYPPPAAVPELEDYAAAAFLVLALTIGWQVRRRQLPV